MLAPERPDGRPWLPAGITILAALAASGLVVFTDHLVWDGLLVRGAWTFDEGRKHMGRLFMEAGRPLDFLFHDLFGRTGNPTAAAKIAGCVEWIACAVLVRRWLDQVCRLGPWISTSVAVLSATLPVFDVLGELSLTMQSGSALLFWMAVHITSGLSNRRGAQHAGWRFMALVLFFLSFNFNALLVYAYCLAATVPILRGWVLSWRASLHWGVRHLDFAVLPVVFWIAKTTLTPTTGYYRNYNQPSLSPQRILAHFANTWNTFIVPESIELAQSPVVLLTALACAVVAVARLRPSSAPQDESRPGARLALAGAILLAGSLLPFAAVDQPVSAHGWWSRHALMLGLPLGLMLTGGAILATGHLRIGGGPAWLVPVATIGALGVVASNRAILRLQGLGAKQVAVARSLDAEIGKSGSAVVQVRDYAWIPLTVDAYPPLMWTFLATRPGKPPSCFVIDTVPLGQHTHVTNALGEVSVQMPKLPVTPALLEEMMNSTTMPYILGQIPRKGPQTLAVIQPGEGMKDGVSMGMEYLRLRWTSPGDLPAFLGKIIRITSIPIEPIE